MSLIQLSTHTTPEAIDWIRTLLATIDYSENITVSSYIESKDESWQMEGNHPGNIQFIFTYPIISTNE